jgi:HD-like signal output (HDOD) protein
MSVKKILFVDDEQHILDGLANLLRKQRKRWQMSFALGAEAALGELRKADFDVVVTDMRMPGMDGAALLKRVKEEHPGTARIVLSGHAEREAVITSLSVAHQFLSKPSTAEALTSVIERTCALQALLSNDRVRKVIGELDRLPSTPATYLELVTASADPDTGVADLARIVERDPAMSIKVLQLVNSAFFGLAHPMASVSRAVNYLGADLLKSLALGAHVFGMLEATGVRGFSLERLQNHALLCGRMAGHFARDDRKRSEEAMTAAMVKDAGKIVLCKALPEEFERVVSTVQGTGRAFHLVEQEQLGLTHAEIGAYLLGVWGLPFPIVEAVAYHHRPAFVTEGEREVLAAIHVAAVLVEDFERGRPPADGLGGLDHAFLEQAGFAARLPEWRELAARELSSPSGGKR